MFCPFTKDNCNYDCAFHNGTSENPNDHRNCVLFEAAIALNSLKFDTDSTVETYLKGIDENTGSDQTESSAILSKLDGIARDINEIKENLQ